ncbi:MAG: aminoacyl-tRNA hydrolase [Methylococcaceae bacterium]|nr:aminoacyl-tRNA hydrolase [Methylococcaceae bacterium]
MIRLIIGLGNPGRQYEKTRHNAGFWFVDRLADQYNASWTLEKKIQGRVAAIEIVKQKIQILKPETFMNLSGQSVVSLMKYYQISSAECLVIHDELDFEAGVVRLKQGGGHGGHNGLRSIIACVGSNEFPRLRIGIGKPKTMQSVADYVLATPEKIELKEINAAFNNVFQNLEQLVSGDFELVMRKIHI